MMPSAHYAADISPRHYLPTARCPRRDASAMRFIICLLMLIARYYAMRDASAPR